MSSRWDPVEEGTIELPSGSVVRGRSLRRPRPAEDPDLGLYLTWGRPPPTPWASLWLRWPDFGLPLDPAAARRFLIEIRERAASQRVEIGCPGGIGRTGTAIACLAVLDGLPGSEAVAFVRAHYHRRAVETPWQRRFVSTFGAVDDPPGPGAAPAVR